MILRKHWGAKVPLAPSWITALYTIYFWIHDRYFFFNRSKRVKGVKRYVVYSPFKTVAAMSPAAPSLRTLLVTASQSPPAMVCPSVHTPGRPRGPLDPLRGHILSSLLKQAEPFLSSLRRGNGHPGGEFFSGDGRKLEFVGSSSLSSLPCWWRLHEACLWDPQWRDDFLHPDFVQDVSFATRGEIIY